MHRAIIGCILFCIAVTGFAQQPGSLSKINKELAAFKAADDLEGWIYHRIEYVDAKPTERINFLMQTQQQAWRSFKSYTERIAWFYMMATQGYYQLQSGNILSSIASYENALQFYESYPLPDADVVEYVLKPLGNNYTRLADYNTALFIHQKTLTAAIKKGDRNTIASVYSNMAACSRWKGDLKEAGKFCLEGISYVDQKKLLYGLLLSTYADILAVQERYDTAWVVVSQSLQQLKNFGNDMQALYWYTSALQTASRIALHEDKYEATEEYAAEALRLFNKYFPGLRQREKAKIYVLLGDIMKDGYMMPQALQYYQDALLLMLPSWKPKDLYEPPPATLFYSENTFGDALAGKAAALTFLGAYEASLAHYLSCFAAEKKLRAAFFYTESKYKELEVTRSRSNAAMDIAYVEYEKAKQRKKPEQQAYLDRLLLIAELSKAQILADERIARLEPTQGPDSLTRKIRQLEEAVNYYQHEAIDATDKKSVNNLLQATEYELAMLLKKVKKQDTQSGLLLDREAIYEMLKTLPQDVTLLEFFEGATGSYIIEADANGVHSASYILGSEIGTSIKQFTQQWFFNGASAMQNEPMKFYKASNKIYSEIFDQYEWKKDRRYILVTDGMFNYLPFDALLTSADFTNKPYLFKQANLSHAFSLQTWQQQQKTTYQPGTFSGFFVSGGNQTKLAVEEEHKSLQPLVSGQYFINNAATWQHFNNAADSAYVLHIGSHAMMTSEDSVPFLQLFDKPFYLFDLRYKNFSPALVVLGACKTADGLLLQGEGVNSLSRGFTAAGAGGVVSGLWNVNDETAIAFMQVFYKKLQQHDAAFALQEAKREWLKDHQDNPALQLPYYWSGFIYSGHLQPIMLPSKNNNWWYFAIPLLIIVVSFILWRKRRYNK